MRRKRSLFQRIVMKLRGIIWQEVKGSTTYTLYRSGWVVISDGVSEDAIPISYCSQEFVDRIEKDLAAEEQ
jgi:hypothetical protein